jgi:serine/threonine-protein kinase HipA
MPKKIATPQAELHVFWDTEHVGTLEARPNGRIRFTYDKQWLEIRDFPISISMPCRKETYDAQTSTVFFENCVPEGGIKAELAQARHIDTADTFSFLREYGRDMAGAISILDKGEPDTDEDYEDITEALESELSRRDPEVPINLFLLFDANLSLAGGQDKLPVLYKNGRFLLSRKSSPTSHIIKPMHSLFRDMPYNEHFCMSLAGKTGLPAQGAAVVTLGGTAVYMIERYDRYIKDGRIFRLHQEDFCQALTVPAEHKYQINGGPGWQELVNVMVDNPFEERMRSLNALVDAAIFNFIVGNTDAHAKNFSILYDRENRSMSLAPLYDICSVYPYRDHIRHNRIAMSIGKKFNTDKLTVEDWREFAAIFSLAVGDLAEKIDKMAHSVTESIPETLEEHAELYKSTNIPGVIAKKAMEIALVMKNLAEKL